MTEKIGGCKNRKKVPGFGGDSGRDRREPDANGNGECGEREMSTSENHSEVIAFFSARSLYFERLDAIP